MIEYLTKEQVDKITQEFNTSMDTSRSSWIRKAREKHLLVFLGLRYSGARIEEMVSPVHPPTVDTKSLEMEITTLKQRGKGKAPRRVIPIPEPLAKAFSLYGGNGDSFAMDQSNFRKYFKTMCQRANIPERLAHPHSLRHYRAHELLTFGVNLQVVSQVLGHSSLATTEIYTKLSVNDLKSQMRKAGAA